MALTRIQFDGTSDHGTVDYTLPINPAEIVLPQTIDSDYKKSMNPIDGESIVFTPAFDNRRGKLIWRGFPTDHTIFSGMATILETYITSGIDRYMHLQDIGTPVGMGAWNYIKPISIDKKLRGGGPLIWDEYSFVFELAEA